MSTIEHQAELHCGECPMIMHCSQNPRFKCLARHYGERLALAIPLLDQAYDIISEHAPGHSVWLDQCKEAIGDIQNLPPFNQPK